MITFHELTYRNFLSTGANPITIQLDRSKTTLIIGANGSGKSTILDALSFALFGKAHRNVPKPMLVNSVNGKGCEVSITFDSSGHHFKIIRGIKPNNFEVWQDGSMIDQSASVRDYQKFLEQNILKLNHKSFHQIVVLGSSSFVPFMQLSSNHRREVVEDLLDINIFSKMKGILKDRSVLTRNNAKSEKASLDVFKGKHEYQEKYIKKIESLNETAQVDNDDAIKALQNEIGGLVSDGINLTNDVKKFPGDVGVQIKAIGALEMALVQQLGELKSNISNMTRESKFFIENESCPTCTQSITDTFRKGKLTSITKTINDSTGKRDTTQLQLNEHGTNKIELQDIEGKVNDISNQLSRIQHDIETKKTSIDKLKSSVQIQDLTEAYGELQKLQVNADECRDVLDECNDQLLYNDIAGEMLKDTGIRTKVIREYLPAMNTLINQYLQTLDFFVAFTLDENFYESIRSRHRDNFSYANFSEGEKMRIDLALLFTWRQIAKMKNSTNTNLLILDETFDSSLDTDGVDNLLKILMTLEDYTNTFIISHKPDILEPKMKGKIEFTKTNNFSRIL